ncbi:ASCH domain-containing protein [uncultured Bacteroides sp.]|uniref:ASCH domain-containing protein n=1 Tax=uncultured Bacteroides sp. TaxID=162156 RepID=UPI00262AAE11|nr:ASCH domain-containing protein [uncultured Bacteroides sp.]
MEILTLSIKQKYFDEILSGKKLQEYREIRPSNSSRYIRYVLNSKEYKNPDDMPSEDEEPGEVTLSAVKYDAIKFLTGEYKGKRPYIIVEVLSSEIKILTDENDQEIELEEKGVKYIAAQMVYGLGKVIEKSDY